MRGPRDSLFLYPLDGAYGCVSQCLGQEFRTLVGEKTLPVVVSCESVLCYWIRRYRGRPRDSGYGCGRYRCGRVVVEVQ